MVKVVRNPFDRAVSSYIAALGTGSEDIKLSSSLGRKIDSKKRSKDVSFTFREFVRHLQDELDNPMCSIHNLRQYHPSEKKINFHIDYLIRLEDGLFSGLNKIESDMNLPLTDFRNKLLFDSGHHTKRIKTNRFQGDNRFVRTQEAFPICSEFYDDEIKGIINNIYREDFIRYGYSHNHLIGSPNVSQTV